MRSAISSNRLCIICFGLRGSVNSITEVATLLIVNLTTLKIDIEYTWPVNWDIPDFTSILEPLYFMHSLHSTHPNLLPLLRSLGPHFLRSFTSALLASNQHFPSLLLLATLYGLRSGHIFFFFSCIAVLPAVRAHNPLRPRNLRSWENLYWGGPC